MRLYDFMQNCIACGGDWTTMIKTGAAKLWPNEYAAAMGDSLTFLGIISFVEKQGVIWE